MQKLDSNSKYSESDFDFDGHGPFGMVIYKDDLHTNMAPKCQKWSTNIMSRLSSALQSKFNGIVTVFDPLKSFAEG